MHVRYGPRCRAVVRPGETIFPRRPRGSGWPHDLLVGTEPTYRGYMNVSGISIGTVQPPTYRGRTLTMLAQNAGSNTLHIDFGSVQLSGVTVLVASFLGGPGPINVTWNGGAFRYIASGQSALTTFMNANVGKTVRVTLS